MDASIDRDTQQQGPTCALRGNELTDRLRAWRDLDARARLRQDARPERVTTFYRRDPDVTARLEQLVALESECCADLLRFDLSYHGDEAVLEVTAGPLLDQDVDELIASAVHGHIGNEASSESPGRPDWWGLHCLSTLGRLGARLVRPYRRRGSHDR